MSHVCVYNRCFGSFLFFLPRSCAFLVILAKSRPEQDLAKMFGTPSDARTSSYQSFGKVQCKRLFGCPRGNWCSTENLEDCGLRFIDDNSGNWKLANRIEMMPWPAHSPALREKQLEAMQLHFEDLEQTVSKFWDKTAQKFIEKL